MSETPVTAMKPGRRIRATPAKPTSRAQHNRPGTGSPSHSSAMRGMNSGAVKPSKTASARGRCVSA